MSLSMVSNQEDLKLLLKISLSYRRHLTNFFFVKATKCSTTKSCLLQLGNSVHGESSR